MTKGIDVSEHNGTIDFQQCKGAGVDFVYIKATEGTTFQDALTEEHYVGAQNAGIKTGFYHFLVGTSEPETQAANFYNIIKNKSNNLKPCLDVEKSDFDVMDFTIRFIEAFARLTDMNILLYTYVSFADENLDARLGAYPCWIAHYGVDNPRATSVWGENYAGHQYTEHGSIAGVSGNVDVNNFTELVLLDASESVTSPTESDNSWEICESNTSIASSFLGTSYRIKLVQLLLNCFGYALTPDGVCGDITTEAIRAFQASYNLTQDYKFGNQCFSQAYELIKSTLCGVPYSTPSETKVIQYILGITVDGVFLDQTQEAVEDYQSAKELRPDGKVGEKTWKELLQV